MTIKTSLAAGALSALSAFFTVPAAAQTIDYSFAGLYNTIINGSFVSLPYTGTFTITDPVETSVKPFEAADTSLPVYADIWTGTSTFYTGATQLVVTFANGATLAAPGMGLVVNNTTLSEAGAPYPLGLSVQLYAQGFSRAGMTASKVCADGTIDDACDASGESPLYRQSDVSDQAVLRLTGAYQAFWGAPLSTVAAGVPDLAQAFGPSNGGLGLYATNDLGQATTTLTQYQQLSSLVTASPVPEPSAYALAFTGLLAVGWLRRGQRNRRA